MEQFLCLKASAGSGKTFALTVRYISLLFLDVHPTSILTLTFTNKAVAEMSNRIYLTLKNLENKKDILKEISSNTQLDIKTILLKKDEVFNKYIKSELSIYTIDKFINIILKEFSGYVNISDDFTIDNDDEDLILYTFLSTLGVKEFNDLIYFSYNYSYKLNKMIKVFKVLDEKNESLNIIEFDKELQKNIEDTILKSAYIIKDFVLNSDLSSSAKKAVDFNTITQLLNKGKTWLNKNSLKDYSYFKKVMIPDELENHFDNIKANLALYFQYKQQDILNNLFRVFNHFKEFRLKYKQDKNSFEFKDITNLTYKLMSQIIQKDFLYFRLDIKYNHILIDEFQDTSTLQYKILKPLIDEVLSGYNEKFKTFFYVGDPKQSIYRFRGGNKSLFDWVANSYKDTLIVDILDTNYRSSQNIVNFVNDIFTQVANYEYYPQHIKSKTQGYVKINKFILDEDEPYKDIYEELQELFKAGVAPENIAILMYKNKDIANLYEYLSNKFNNINISTELNSKLVVQPNIKIAINLVRYYFFNENIYKANVNAILNKPLDSDIELKLDIFTLSLEEIIKQIFSYYKIIDDNSIKFLEIISKYKDIVEFVYDIDKDDTSVLSSTKQGLQILTIFKSKGLEFDTVLVLDRVSRKDHDTTPLLFDYDNVNFKQVFYKLTLAENFNIPYQKALNKENQLKRDDSLNVLYVALTRAQNNLIIFKKEKQSEFDILNYDFTPREIGKLHISKSDIEIKDTPDVEYNSLSLGVQEVPKTSSNETTSSIKAKYFGLCTHYCLEMMKNFDKNSLDFAINIAKNKYNNYLNEIEFNEIYKRIEMLLDTKDFKTLISNKQFTKEQELIFKNDIKIIDLLLYDKNQYIIVDYKTSDQFEQLHHKQVSYYKQAISTITKSDQVKGYIVYLLQDEIKINMV